MNSRRDRGTYHHGICENYIPYSNIGRSIEFDKFGFICPRRTLWAKSKWKITTYNYAQVTLWLEIVKFDCDTIDYMSIFHKRITLITMNAYMYP